MNYNIIGKINDCDVYKVNDFLDLTVLVMKEEEGNLFVKTSRSNIRKMCAFVLENGEKVNIDEPHLINTKSGFQVGWCICSNIGKIPVEFQTMIIGRKEYMLHPQNLGCNRNVFFITKKR